MLWFVHFEDKSFTFSSLRAATAAWGLSHTFGKRIEPGVYRISGGSGTDVLIIRHDQLQRYSKFISTAFEVKRKEKGNAER